MKAYFIFFSFLIGLTPLQSQNLLATKEKAESILVLSKRFHVSPKEPSEDMSKFIFQDFISYLNDNGLFLLKSEYDSLQQYQTKIHLEITGKANWAFLPLTDKIFRQALKRTKTLIEKEGDKSIDFKKSEKITLESGAKSDGFLNEKEQLDYIHKYFKYLVIDEMVSAKLDDSTLTVKDLIKKEPDFREKVKKEFIDMIDYYLNDNDGLLLSEGFLSSLCSYFDPHSEYFSINEKKAFEEELSSEDFRFGLSLDENEDGIVIDQLEPGGAAWKSNKLNKGDLLIKIQWEKEEVIDVTGMKLSEVDVLLNRDDKQIIFLTVKKINGSSKTVKLKKEKVELDDNLVKSYLLKGENNFGYISLPDFYSGWEGNSSKGCANDVAKELLKLQKENINGVILDLRNNGGGSLNEALGLAGIFISEGPLLIDQMMALKPIILKDENRGVIYKGPLIVLINGQSASASEVLAACLQDYNRALIVGQNSYGKSTGQSILPLDSTLNLLNFADKINGQAPAYVKLTLSKLYRVTGKSHQQMGVKPDVLLPDFYSSFYKKEKGLPNAIPNDSIIKKVYYTPLQKLPVQDLNAEQEKRNNTDSYFKEFRVVSDSIRIIFDEYKKEFEISLEHQLKNRKNLKRLFSVLSDQPHVRNEIFKAANHSYEEAVVEMDSYYKELNKDVLSAIEKDIELIHTYKILSDLINIKP